MKIIWIEETGSTNSEVVKYFEHFPEGVILATHCQTAGRGQKGNSWEAEPYRNLSLSAMWRPEGFEAICQFSISEAVALSVVDMLATEGIEAKVKWPNDIYVGDKKICGILIEHSIMGREIFRTIAGVGINVNQTHFLSDAPNPVSMSQISGKEYSLESLLEKFSAILATYLEAISSEDGRNRIHHRFCNNMWRFDGKAYPFRERVSGELFKGIIEDVDDTGLLHILNIHTGLTHRCAFKEVEFLLSLS